MSQILQNTKKSAAFTLVEMLIVIAMMAILAAGVAAGVNNAREMAWKTKAGDTARQIADAWALFAMDGNPLPTASKLRSATEGGVKGFTTVFDNLKYLNYSIVEDETARAELPSTIYLELSGKEREKGGTGIKDHWNHYFFFNLDFDLTGRVEHPAPELFGRKKDSYTTVNATAIAWSVGPKVENKRKWLVHWR